MITYSIIQKSQLEGAHRLDAEYYQPEYFIDFTKRKWRPIGDILESCQYGLSKAMNDEKKGYPIFKMDDINNAFLFDDYVRFADIAKSTLDQFEIKKDDVFFNRVNSEEFVGRTGIYKLNSLKSVFASYLIRMQTKTSGDVLPDYLNIFLNSAYGLKQIRKFSRRAVNQANVNAEELKQIKIAVLPIMEQEKIRDLSNQSWYEFTNSKSLYSQAENLLLEELGLQDFHEEDELYHIMQLSEIKKANRIDAEYFQEKYEKLELRIKNYESYTLEEVIENIPAKFNPAKQPDKSFKYVELSNINVSIGIVDGFLEVLGKNAPSRAKRVLEEDDIIVSSVEGSLEKAALVRKEQKDFLASTGFFQFRSEEILPEVLLVLAKSIVFQWQLEKRCAGTILTAVPKESINDILVPLLPKPIQRKIANLVRQSHQARKKARELLAEAKQKVEDMIEKRDVGFPPARE